MSDPSRILEDRQAWQHASSSDQDAAVAAVLEQLGDFSHLGTADHAAGGQAHRVATLRHEPTAIDYVQLNQTTKQFETWLTNRRNL